VQISAGQPAWRKRKRGEKTHANGPDKQLKKWEATSTTASTFPSTSLGGQQFQDGGREGATPDISPYSSHGLDRSYRHLQKISVPTLVSQTPPNTPLQ
jgi:hypothetical protein